MNTRPTKETIEAEAGKYCIDEHGIENGKQYERGYSANGFIAGCEWLLSELSKEPPVIAAENEREVEVASVGGKSPTKERLIAIMNYEHNKERRFSATINYIFDKTADSIMAEYGHHAWRFAEWIKNNQYNIIYCGYNDLKWRNIHAKEPAKTTHEMYQIFSSVPYETYRSTKDVKEKLTDLLDSTDDHISREEFIDSIRNLTDSL